MRVNPDLSREIIPPRAITELAWRNRFTEIEKALLELYAVHDHSASYEDQLKAAWWRAKMGDSRAAKWHDLDDPDLIEATHGMELAGVLAKGRAAEILGGEVQEHERYKKT